MRTSDKKFALALCGGGGKGAYQIGVWKALAELDMTKNIEAVSGTSVGALNAVLIALGDLENAERIWKSIRPETLLSVDTSDGQGMFTREGLTEILDSVDLTALAHKMDVFISAYDVYRHCTVYRRINNMTRSEMTSILLASSAIPIAYSSVDINGSTYIDGGFKRTGNAPIQPLYDNGHRNIFIAALDNKFNINNISDGIGQHVDIANKYPGARFTEIVPLEPLGNVISGTLNFNIGKVRDNIKSGYADTMKELKNEEVYIMRNNYTKINFTIKKKVSQLFGSAREFEEFIKTANFGRPNLKMPTLGGKICYENICEIYGWKIQQHNISLAKFHYRILDNNDMRRAWFTDPEDFLAALEDYETSKKFDY